MKDFLFPKPIESTGYSIFLLAMRIFFGLMLMVHGINKFIHYADLCFTFPDPIGFGSEIGLQLAIFAELICSVGFILGAFYRLCMIPMLATMAVAFLFIHRGNIAEGEMAFIYFYTFLLMYIAGPGKFSIDTLLYNHFKKKTYREFD